jgi:glycosyltransferase involved in cell wall biosynthesis
LSFASLLEGPRRNTTGVTRPTIAILQPQAENAGAQEIARVLGQSWSKKGIEVHYCFFFRRTESFDKLPNVYFAHPDRPQAITQVARMSASLLRYLRIVQPDIAVTFQPYGNILGAPIARAAGIKYIIANLNSSLSTLPAWMLAADWLLAASGVYSRIIANSGKTTADYARLPPPFARRIVRIDHGFAPRSSDKTKAEAREAFGVPPDAVLLGTVGRLHRLKNHPAVIALLPQNLRWQFAIAGQGELLAELKLLSDDLGCRDRVHFLGELPPEKIGLFLKALDVFVFPSLSETFGLAAVEAAQSGLPVVCNDLEVMREVLQVDGEPCALFCNAGDHSALALAIRKSLNGQPTLSSTAAKLREKYALERMIDQYSEVISQLGIKLP